MSIYMPQTVKKFKLIRNEYVPFVTDDNGQLIQVVWAAQPGSQAAFLDCPTTEVLYEGTRGPGKTDALLMGSARSGAAFYSGRRIRN
jgi:hypothetical protein